MISHFYKKTLSLILIVIFVTPSIFLLYPPKTEAADPVSCAATYLGSLFGFGATVTAVDAPVETATAVALSGASIAVGVADTAAVTAAVGYPLIGWPGGGAELGAIATILGAQTVILAGLTAQQTAGHVPAVQSATTNTQLSFSECILKPLAIKLAKEMLYNITVSTVNWINNGFHGNPSFVKDLNGFLADTTDQVIGDFIQNDLKAGFLCTSFALQVRIALAETYMPYRQKSACTLTDVRNNVSGFIENNNSGGWENWLQVTTEPQNNVFGATILAQDELARKITTKLNIENKNLDWGKGFRNFQVCESDQEFANRIREANGYGADVDVTGMGSKKCETTTPGAVVESQLELALGSSVRQLEVAQDINAIIGALTNQLMAQVIKGGQGLLGAGKKSNGSYGSVKYNSAMVVDPDLTDAINTAISQASPDFVASDASSTPESSDIDTSTTTSQFSWRVTSQTTTVDDYTNLYYDLRLNANPITRNLIVTTTLKKSDVRVPFINIFSPLQLSHGKSDSYIPSQYIYTQDYSSMVWTNITVDDKADFIVRYSGNKKPNAPTGVYTIETTVSDATNHILGTRTDTFIVQ